MSYPQKFVKLTPPGTPIIDDNDSNFKFNSSNNWSCTWGAPPISDRSPYHWIYLGLTQGKYELCVTTEILLEYAEIIEQHMGFEVSESVQGVLDNLTNVHFINSYFRFDLIKKDKDDNKFVDCAIAANANFIVSEDKDFRVLKKIAFPKVEVLSVEKFRKKLEEAGI